MTAEREAAIAAAIDAMPGPRVPARAPPPGPPAPRPGAPPPSPPGAPSLPYPLRLPPPLPEHRPQTFPGRPFSRPPLPHLTPVRTTNRPGVLSPPEVPPPFGGPSLPGVPPPSRAQPPSSSAHRPSISPQWGRFLGPQGLTGAATVSAIRALRLEIAIGVNPRQRPPWRHVALMTKETSSCTCSVFPAPLRSCALHFRVYPLFDRHQLSWSSGEGTDPPPIN